MTRQQSATPPVALVLGSGGARGLAHLLVLETLDELGLKPAAMTGASIGAIIGAAYASGIAGRDLREHFETLFFNRTDVMARLWKARVGRVKDLFARNPGNPVLVDGEALLDLFWPTSVPDTFEDLDIPLTVIATDFYQHCEIRLKSGSLVSAVAASMAMPALVKPVQIDGRVLIDGGAINPLPIEPFLDTDHDCGGCVRRPQNSRQPPRSFCCHDRCSPDHAGGACATKAAIPATPYPSEAGCHWFSSAGFF